MPVLLYDWFSCTLPLTSDYFMSDVSESGLLTGQPFIRMLGMNHLSFEVASGVRGYASRLYFDGISIHIPRLDNPTANIWLEMSGRGCRAFETYGSGDWDSLFLFARKHCNITRIDVACDDHEGTLDIKRILDDYYFKELFVSNARHHEVHMSWEDEKAQLWRKGITIDCGSPKSDVFIRIYDKAAQLGREGEHWIRVEIQLRHKRASEFLALDGDLGQKYFGILGNSLRFVVPSPDSNKWRWPTSDYWQAFLNDVQPIKWPEKPGVSYNMSKLESWLISQCGNSIYTYLKTFGKDALEKMIIDTRSGPLPAKYVEVIQKFFADHDGSVSEGEFITAMAV